jgi:hypothetical protein
MASSPYFDPTYFDPTYFDASAASTPTPSDSAAWRRPYPEPVVIHEDDDMLLLFSEGD